MVAPNANADFEPNLASWRRLLEVLGPADVRRLKLVLFAVLGGSLIDVIGLSSVVPFLALVGNPGLIEKIGVLADLYRFSGAESVRSFIVLLGFLCLCLVVTANVYSYLLQLLIVRYSYGVSRRISLRLMRHYVAQPYTFYLSRNSAGLVTSTIGEVEGVVNGVLMPALQGVGKLAAAAFMLAALVIVDPVAALVLFGCLGSMYGLIGFVTRARIERLGLESQSDRRKLFAVAHEVFNGIKELKYLGREETYVTRFANSAERLRLAQVRLNSIAAVPRFAIEGGAIGGGIAGVLFLLMSGKDLQAAIPVLLMYAVAGYRLMPAVQAVFHNFSIVRFNWASVRALHQEGGAEMAVEVVERAGRVSERKNFEERILLRDIRYRYPGSEVDVLSGIRIEIPKNSVIGLVGETGAGKSTIVDIVLGLLSPSSGKVLIDDTVLEGAAISAWQNCIGYVPQQGFLADATIRENIAFGVPYSQIDDARILAAADVAQLHRFVADLPDGFETVVGERGVRLSGGQRQRIALARALYWDPPVLVLDEATSALDGITESTFIDALSRLRGTKTVLAVAHRLSTLKDCTRIYVLENGNVADSGTFEELLEHNARFRAMAGAKAAEGFSMAPKGVPC